MPLQGRMECHPDSGDMASLAGDSLYLKLNVWEDDVLDLDPSDPGTLGRSVVGIDDGLTYMKTGSEK